MLSSFGRWSLAVLDNKSMPRRHLEESARVWSRESSLQQSTWSEGCPDVESVHGFSTGASSESWNGDEALLKLGPFFGF
jgi:hypothetical protein